MSDELVGVMAYLVGGPADGREIFVSPSSLSLMMPEWRGTSIPVAAHEYRPCRETGEWLWQGVR